MDNRKTLLSVFGNTHQVVHHDVARPDDLIIETVEDVEPIIQRAKMLSEMSPKFGETFRHVAIAPDFVCAKALRERWSNEDWDKWLNDGANKPFRTWQGSV